MGVAYDEKTKKKAIKDVLRLVKKGSSNHAAWIEVAEGIGCSTSCVQRWMRIYNEQLTNEQE